MTIFDIQNGVMYDCKTDESTVSIPEEVVRIGACAFYQINSLTKITIPTTVKEIRACAFFACRNLAEVTIKNELTKYSQQSFVDCSKNLKIIKGKLS